jgi:hypothetical protein
MVESRAEIDSFDVPEPGGRIGFAEAIAPYARNITIDSLPVYVTGNTCGSCGFFFQRIGKDAGTLTADEISARLNRGLASVDGEIIETTLPLLPPGRYWPRQYVLSPTLTRLGEFNDYYTHERVASWGRRDEYWGGIIADPMTAYYRGRTLPIDAEALLFEFIAPLQSFESLDVRRVDYYKSTMATGYRPTALALSDLSVQELVPYWDYDDRPEDKPAITAHWCVTHYLIDGHHKMRAAADLGLPIRILSMLGNRGNKYWTEYVEKVLPLLEA